MMKPVIEIKEVAEDCELDVDVRPDPEDVAPALYPTVVESFFDRNRFLFEGTPDAEMVLPDGMVQPFASIDVRATEYTVGGRCEKQVPEDPKARFLCGSSGVCRFEDDA